MFPTWVGNPDERKNLTVHSFKLLLNRIGLSGLALVWLIYTVFDDS